MRERVSLQPLDEKSGQVIYKLDLGKKLPVMKRILFLSVLVFAGLAIYAQYEVEQIKFLYGHQIVDSRKEIRIPDIMGYKTLKCDFHMHTNYSDGFVIPRERVEQAWREGLDAIAITDHEPVFSGEDRNINYNLGKRHAHRLGVILIHGIEYSMEPPVGHLNFLFIEDANKYIDSTLTDKQLINMAADDGAFIMINHSSTLSDFQRGLVEQNKIHAMEVINDRMIYLSAIDFCNQHNMTKISSTDIHRPIHSRYDIENKLRNLTFVLAEDNTEESIKEALFAGRTIGFGDDYLIANEEYLKELIKASLVVTELKMEISPFWYTVHVKNTTDITYTLEGPNQTQITFYANRTVILRGELEDVDAVYKVTNTYISSTEHLELPLSFFTDLIKKK